MSKKPLAKPQPIRGCPCAWGQIGSEMSDMRISGFHISITLLAHDANIKMVCDIVLIPSGE